MGQTLYRLFRRAMVAPHSRARLAGSLETTILHRPIAKLFLRLILPLALSLALPMAALADPTLWKITSGPTTVYLYGSVHLLKPDVKWNTAKVETAMGQAQELWLEISDVDDPGAMKAVVQQLGTDPGHPLTAQLDPAHQQKLAEILKSLNAPATALDGMRPWLASVTLSVLPVQRAGFDPAAGVDKALKLTADKQSKPVKAFETTEQQLHYLADIPQAEQLDMLNQSIDEYDQGVELLNQMANAWERGDQAEVARLMRSDMPDNLYQLLIVQRNMRFAAKLVERIKSGGVIFVAVGAGHLAGPDSVQAQLAKAGLVTEEVH
jgi:uncharacterized protein YbaP (TraB family)